MFEPVIIIFSSTRPNHLNLLFSNIK